MSKKPTPGHKRGTIGVSLGCECGWRSATWMGKGALRNANAEWQSHVEKHQLKAEAA